MSPQELQSHCLSFAARGAAADPAHDLDHIKRVVKNATYLSDSEGVNTLITLPAACLHDCVAVPKDSARRVQASRLAAEAAVAFLAGLDYPPGLLPDVFHAIEAHSYSAGVAPRTAEARVVQDADRLDSLGAIGIARCLLVGGRLDRPLCAGEDPFCEQRAPDDSRFTIDHFYAKLLKLPATMQTAAGRAEAERRAGIMLRYLDDLRAEIL
ncbi:MAG: HD domain-containing protein [Xanthomonadales bacterium]|nr:HD domain-containing protein [Xanthomonadales bacterium]